MAMVVTNRARFLTLCAMLALLPLGRALADPTIKPAITGLISTGSPTNTLSQLAKANATGIFGGIVIQVKWKDIEPNPPATSPPTASDFDFTVIENALSQTANDNVTEYNAALPSTARQLGVRLRVFAGCSGGDNDAPAWAMQLDTGFPITVWAQYNDAPESCELGQFWNTNSNYAKAWRALQTQLALKYDANPLIREVAVTSCTSFSAEPFFLNLKPPQWTTDIPAPDPVPPLPADALTTAHYSDPLYQECLTNAIDDYAPWQMTRLEFSFNGFGGVGGQNDIGVSEQIMRKCRVTLGPRCILSNHDLDTVTPTTILPVYVFERKFGPNITFQALHVVPADFEGTIRKAVSLGAGSIEIWQEPAAGSFEHQSRDTLINWAKMFEPQ
jgi:hypothetical protein